MKPTYPNLELIEYKAQLIISRKQKDNPLFDFSLITFPQVWGSTCTGFDIMPDGKPVFSGSAMTKEYTTVVQVAPIDMYFVFFGNKPAYTVTNPNENFLNDLKERNMAPVSLAEERYSD